MAKHQRMAKRLSLIAISVLLLYAIAVSLRKQHSGGVGSKWTRPLNCQQLIAGSRHEIDKTLRLTSTSDTPPDYRSDGDYNLMNCSQLTRGYWTGTVSKVELQTPIAFVINAYKDFYQLNRLLQAVYRQHNEYCVHVDSKADFQFKLAARGLAGCLDNMQIIESPVNWGSFSVLDSDMRCFSSLLRINKNWIYLINLTGQEYPIRTMKEIAQILQAMNGTNIVEKAGGHVYTVQYPPIPQLPGLNWYKGAVHVVLYRPAVQFMVNDQRARIIYEHIRANFKGKGYDQVYPDETFYSTLNHNYKLLGMPGSYTGRLYTGELTNQQIFRYKLWRDDCRSGLSVRSICIIGLGDLSELDRAPHLFVNKFYYNFQWPAFACAQWRFWRNTRADYDVTVAKTQQLDLDFYRRLDSVLHHL